MKNKLLIVRNVAIIFAVFMLLLLLVSQIFRTMDTKTKKLNEETVEDIGFTYISNIARQTVNHSHTYFNGKFEAMHQAIDNITASDLSISEAQEYMNREITSGTEYVAFIDSSGQRHFFNGDDSFVPLDMESFQKYWQKKDNKVILTVNDKKERLVELILFYDFSIDGTDYSAFVCGISPDTLNNVLTLYYGKDMVYSFIVRKRDSDFVVRNEDAVSKTYFDRIRGKYGVLDGKTPDDYISQFSEAMKNNEEYQSMFLIDDEKRMLYACPLSYSDWYLITFMHYDEMAELLKENNDKRNTLFNSYFIFLCIVFLVIFSAYALVTYFQLKKQQELKRRAIAANKSKSEFLSNMSHDIRTPMNVIVGMTNIALTNINDRERTEDCLNKIAKSSKHLLSLINDVLDMSKIESGKMTLSLMQVSLKNVMDNIVAIAQPSIKAKNQKFDIYIKDIISEDIICDSLRLNQVLINLVSNAIKYTPAEGMISISICQENSPRGENYVRTHFSVKNNGIGMTEEFQKRVFESFVREDKERVTKEEGTGLGLAITKHIVDVMNGTIEVESKPQQGSLFHVTLDLEKGTQDLENVNLNGVRVLIVDDDIDLCLSAVNSLEALKAVPEFVTSGEMALEKVRNSPDKYDVILMDWQLGGIDGIETTRKLRQFTSPDILIILISAYDWSEVENQATESGINGFISKPLFSSTLFYGIDEYLHIPENKEKIEAEPVNFSGERILLAEDNELNSEIATAILEGAGLQVDWAENGKICVEMFSNSQEGYYAAVLMDIRMPVMNGYEAAEAIRNTDRKDADIPIIAMTADAFAEDIAKAAKSGMNGHIAKPLDINSLFYQLKRELQNRK